MRSMTTWLICRAHPRLRSREGLWLLLAAILLSPGPAEAARLPESRVCDGAAETAARRHGVPLDVMLAITRTETGRQGERGLEPWPWTVNMEGQGVWFDTEEEALSYVFTHFKRGARSFDVGCFQINYKWHGTAFRSINEMFDPFANANYAAAFLASLFEELGSWTEAAGAYHSRTPEFADRYAARFERIRERVAETGPWDDDAPILRAGFRGPGPLIDIDHHAASGRLGSLVPLPAAGAGASLWSRD